MKSLPDTSTHDQQYEVNRRPFDLESNPLGHMLPLHKIETLITHYCSDPTLAQMTLLWSVIAVWRFSLWRPSSLIAALMSALMCTYIDKIVSWRMDL